MGHLTRRSYNKLWRRLDQFPQGVSNSPTLYEILKILFTEEEARLASVMPLRIFTARDMAKIWKKSEKESGKILETLAGKALVNSYQKDGKKQYYLSPPVMGFFEFSLMRLDNKFDKKKLSKLFYKYMNMEKSLPKKYSTLDPYFSRVFVHEDEIKDLKTEVLSYEKVHAMIDKATRISAGTCYCRHKMEHMGMACDNPREVCLTFNEIANHLIEHGIAREITKKEAHKIIDKCVKRGLVQLGDNIKNKLVMVCNCCGCCCEVLLAYKKFGPRALINPSNYIARINPKACIVCGNCIKKCPVNAISIKRGKVTVDTKKCIGCGVCCPVCPTGANRLVARSRRPSVPESVGVRVGMQAVQQGKIGNFIFDDQKSFVHFILRNLVNFLVKIPLVRMILLSRPVSKFIINRVSKSKMFLTAIARK